MDLELTVAFSKMKAIADLMDRGLMEQCRISLTGVRLKENETYIYGEYK